jgi:hypothetical protein
LFRVTSARLEPDSESNAMLLGWGDGRLEGDMGLNPMASRHPTRATSPQTSLTKSAISRMGLRVVAGGFEGFASQEPGRLDRRRKWDTFPDHHVPSVEPAG